MPATFETRRTAERVCGPGFTAGMTESSSGEFI